jgi:septum formation protein
MLSHIGVPFDVIPSDVDESSVTSTNPRALAMKLALMKADDVSQRLPADHVILAADTVVALEGEVFGKPNDRADAERMLRALRGVTHSVITGVAVAVSGGRCEVDAVETRVTMRDFDDEELNWYLDTGEPLDKAGAYAIQGHGSRLIDSYDGCHCNVVGLPLIRSLRMLGDFMDVSGFPLPCTCEPWPHTRPTPFPWAK